MMEDMNTILPLVSRWKNRGTVVASSCMQNRDIHPWKSTQKVHLAGSYSCRCNSFLADAVNHLQTYKNKGLSVTAAQRYVEGARDRGELSETRRRTIFAAC